MAKDPDILEFVIDGYTPDTLPMERLAQYLLDLAGILGERDHVHFERVGEGSAALRHWVDSPAASKVRAHVAAARVIGSSSPERRAYESLDRKLLEDGASGYIRESVAGGEWGRLLSFPGKNRSTEQESDPEFGPFTEHGTLQGRIINVGGKSQLANINIQQGEDVYYCEATRDLATELAPLLYKVDVRVFGTGKHFRRADGTWEMRSFRITDYEELNQLGLPDVIDRLREITRRVGLHNSILHKLADLRDDRSEA